MKKLLLLLIVLVSCQKEYKLDVRTQQDRMDELVYTYFFSQYLPNLTEEGRLHLFTSYSAYNFEKNEIYLSNRENAVMFIGLKRGNYIPSGLVSTNGLLELREFYKTNEEYFGRHYHKTMVNLLIDMIHNPTEYKIEDYRDEKL